MASLFPSNPTCHSVYGLTLLKAGQLPAAIEQFQQAIKLNPGYAEAFNNLGTAYHRLGDIPQAGACFEQALRCNPDYPEAHYNLGGLLLLANAIPEATSHLEAAVNAKPDYVKARFLLAKCYKLLHKDDRAIATAKMALDMARSQEQDALAADIRKWLKSPGEGR